MNTQDFKVWVRKVQVGGCRLRTKGFCFVDCLKLGIWRICVEESSHAVAEKAYLATVSRIELQGEQVNGGDRQPGVHVQVPHARSLGR